jgi:hypothetical protein
MRNSREQLTREVLTLFLIRYSKSPSRSGDCLLPRSRHPGVPTYGVWGEPYSLAGSKLMLRHNLDFRRMRAPKGG